MDRYSIPHFNCDAEDATTSFPELAEDLAAWLRIKEVNDDQRMRDHITVYGGRGLARINAPLTQPDDTFLKVIARLTAHFNPILQYLIIQRLLIV
jgi:hypothetical protein